MAKRGREGALKRAREKARQEKQEAKREKRAAVRSEAEPEESVDEQALMEEFARISELHEDGKIGTAQYEEDRKRIFVELGIESED